MALDKAEAETKAAYDLADDAKKLAIQASTKSKETKEEVRSRGRFASGCHDVVKTLPKFRPLSVVSTPIVASKFSFSKQFCIIF